MDRARFSDSFSGLWMRQFSPRHTHRQKINPPPQGFDPLRATPDELARHFLPPRPDAKLAPRALKLYERAFAKQVRWPEPVVTPRITYFFRTAFRTLALRTQTVSRGSEASSLNWSGGFVRPRDFSRMVRVQGIWRVPAVSPSDDGTTSKGPPRAREFASSTWIGLDGYDPGSRSLPQLGTGQWLSVDAQGQQQPNTFVWWQWFVRGGKANGQVFIPDVEVSAGDEIYAHIEATGPTTLNFLLVNLTTPFGYSFSVEADQAQSAGSATNRLPVRVEGRTACWVMERPARLDNPELFEFPHFDGTSFETCLAGTDASAASQDVDLARARLLTMVDIPRLPALGSVLCTASVDNPAQIRITRAS